MQVKFYKFISLFICISIISCGPANFVSPLKKEQEAITISLGGPIAKLEGYNVPMPLLSTSYAKGIDSLTSLYGTFYITSALFKTFHIDGGFLYQFIAPYNFQPGFSISPFFILMTNLNLPDTKLYPSTNLNLYWKLNNDLIYTGTNLTVEISSKKAFNENVENHFLFSPFIGYQLNTSSLRYNFEIKYFLPNISNQDIVVDYFSFTSKGAIGFYFSICKSF